MSRTVLHKSFWCIACTLLWCATATAQQDAEGLAFFEKKIRPALVKHCYECHSAEAKELQGSLRLDTREGARKGGDSGPAVAPGKVKESLLIEAVSYTDNFYKMPPAKKLPAEVIADFTKWIEMGAPDPRDGAAPAVSKVRREIDWQEAREFWAFKPPLPADLPQVKDAAWCQRPLDRFILAGLETAGLSPARPLDKRQLIRRATFDLTGLPPTPEEIDAFLADDSPDAYERLIDRLLASPRYGERWGRHWLDVARYADSNGLDENLAYANAFRYRDWVIDAFNADLPYDRFVHEQLAGDLLPARPSESEAERQRRLVATGFLAIGPKMLACDDGRKMELDIVDEQVDTMSRAFLGLTMGCARCHDHKFDPLPTQDYYSLAGIFKSTKTMENFSVVAVWHEHVLATEDEQAAGKAHDERLAAKDQEHKTRRQGAIDQFLAAERGKAAGYAKAALALTALGRAAIPDGVNPIGDRVRPEDLAGRGVLVEAEKFSRGTFQVDTASWGKGIGVLLQQGYAEYDLDLPSAGKYQVELRYAAQDSRPLELSANGKLISKEAAKATTGGWLPDKQEWSVEGTFEAAAGKNVLRLERAGVCPHVDKLLVVKIPESGAVGNALRGVPEAGEKPVPRSLADWTKELSLNEELLRQWVRHVKGLPQGPETLWGKLRAEFDKTPAATELAELKSEEFQKLVNDSAGPFALGDKPERFLGAEINAELDRLAKEKAELEKTKPQFARAMGVREGKIENLPVHIRGNYLTLGEAAPRRFPRVFSSSESPALDAGASGRLQLAQWLTDPAHPLTARVIANRLWVWHFGQGLVRTPDNFGLLGERPTNGPLLDYLALRLVESGWSLKALHRELLLSAAYQMSNAHHEIAYAKDPENRLWWRFPRRRLAAEEIRDSLLAQGDNLNLHMHGQLMPDANRAYVAGLGSKEGTYRFNRRSVYLPVVRSAVYNVFQAFDFAEPSVPAGKREATTVAPQALFMMNGEIVLAESRRMADNLLRRGDLVDSERVQTAYVQLYGRPAGDQEVSRGLDFVSRYETALVEEKVTEPDRRPRAWQGLLRVLMAANEFVYVE